MSTQPSALFSFQPQPAAILSFPVWLWHLYLDYLWSPAPGSWVSSVASSFRVLAVILIAPFVLLTLLDVTSYVIARTLGVVDSTKASTSDLDKHRDCASTATSPLAHPIVLQQEEDEHAGLRSSMSQEHHASVFIAGGNRDTSLDEACLKVPGSADSSLRWPSASSSSELDVHHLRQAHSPGPTAFFFNPSEEHNLALSGANILSPAASRQNSPPLERRRQQHNTTDVSDVSNSTFGSDIELCTQNEQAGSLCVDDGSILRRRGGHSGDVDKRD